MIDNQWYVVLDSAEVGKKPVGVTRLGRKLVFWRDRQGSVRCLSDPCIHRGAALSLGECLGDRIRCPFHGLEFDTSGRCVAIPANSVARPVPDHFVARSFPVHEAHGFIWVFNGTGSEEQPLPEFFPGLEGFSYQTRKDRWPVHYTRAVENQLDVAHLPFVHKKTIGRGGRTVADGPRLTWINSGRFRVDVYNRTEDGIPARFPDELPVKPDGSQHLDLIFPNLWQNYLSRDLRIVVAFAPVDMENTLLYLRLYQRFVTLPLIAGLFNRLFMPLNIRILHEDRRVVSTQIPREGRLDSGEQLFPADMPIIQFRRKNAELQNNSTISV